MAKEVTIRELICRPPTACNEREGQLLVWNAINPPSEMHYYEVANVGEAKRLIREQTDDQLQDDSIVSNAFGLMVCVPVDDPNPDIPDSDGYWEWEEWENDQGEDVLAEMEDESIHDYVD